MLTIGYMGINMYETENPNLKPRESSKFFSLRVLRKFSKSEIAIAEELAIKEECLWLELEKYIGKLEWERVTK